VRTECIITQLIFEHSLRVRFKAETKATSPSENSDISSMTSSPNMESSMDLSSGSHDVDSTIDNPENFANETDENITLHSQDETLHASSSSSSLESSASRKRKDKDKATNLPKQADKDHSSGDNLVGKINNLVTTDLANIVEARDFLVVLVYIPLQITLCIIFLYAVLGWRWVITSSHQCYLIINTFQRVRGTGCHHLVISNHWIRHQAYSRRPSDQAEEDRCSSSDSHGK
jgi:hypothetical protein